MVKFLLLLLIAASCYSLNAKAQCPPSTQVTEVIYPSCSGGCLINLYNWPASVTVYMYDESTSPAGFVGAATMPGTGTDFTNGILTDTSVCIACNLLIAATSQVYNQGGCALFATPVLAVLLNHFSVVSTGEGNTISWTVNMEQQGVTYVLQRSNDCKTFTDIAALKGLGYGDLAKNYSYTDPVLTQESFCYRLKAVESNGRITYSNTISTGSATTGTTIEVYPNPVTDNSFKINIPVGQLPALVRIYTMQGQLVYSEEITEPLSTITASLPGGVYAVKIIGNNGTSTIVKLIKE